MKKIQEKLREIRKNKNISIDEVYNYLIQNGVKVAKKTVYGWDKGTTTPPLKAFLHICQFYGVENVYTLLGMDNTEPKFEVTYEEKRVIERYREYRDEFQMPILKLLDLEDELGKK